MRLLLIGLATSAALAAAGCSANPNVDAPLAHPDNPGLRDPNLLRLQGQAVRRKAAEADPAEEESALERTLDRTRRTVEAVQGLIGPR